MRSLVTSGSQGEQAGRLFLAAVVVVFLPYLPFGNIIAYPFVILTTWFHEMGHGFTAILLGNSFEQLVILPSGSGYALSSIASDASRFERAAIAAGGPIAPSLFGAAFILASAKTQWWKPAFYALTAILVLSVVIWVRSWVGVLVLPALAALFVLVAKKARPEWQRFTLQFIGLLAALSMFRDWDYLFSKNATINGEVMLSDTGQMQAQLALPYWFWAGVIITICFAIVGVSLKVALAASTRQTSSWSRQGWRKR
ncbi:M50 family metallopeptidase [Altererythrobacter lutimaris]|uniref:M50 family metallopeptidase n=1 Tax=Altererythrobacter lutimaris TaxID=2743979 RepID=A0A850HI95_9SPHN|nr:M50 family metallopeptidase [Altererythrobacter lutimaris]NVE95172.1 M50 family metallopeptidase [Altererythrobacter lutimaris]